MCCFSSPVQEVSSTRIFVRSANGPRQFLVYQMQVESAEDVAMILPLPTPPKSMDGDVRFLNLEKLPKFFEQLDQGFPKSRSDDASTQITESPKIKVVEVGSYEASFVPTIADFARLDERFRLPNDVWKSLPQYQDYGFAVFKLKPGKHVFHPMAFDFPNRDPKRLFFPTVHIHDEKFHPKADFDHYLYLQPGPRGQDVMKWGLESSQPAGMLMNVELSQGIVDGNSHVRRYRIRGSKPNQDTWV